MSNEIEHICIPGGGTVGWLSAVYLRRTLNGHGTRHCEITVVDLDFPDTREVRLAFL